jgi:hypothetical protein
MWSIYESYDPLPQTLHLHLISEPPNPPQHPELGKAELLGSFPKLPEARKFIDGYLKYLAYGEERLVRDVQCNQYRSGCNGLGKPCYIGLNAFHCKFREGTD